MKICLINPPQILQKQFGRPYIFQPLGLLYIAAVLEKNYFVQVIDASAEGWKNLRETNGAYFLGLSFENIERKLREIKPDVVGITIPFSINAASALKVASIAKNVNKKIVTITGGPHVTVRPLETLSSPYIDFVVVGEGEETVRELIQKIEMNSPRFRESVIKRTIGHSLRHDAH
ncbi:MAG: cobalamin-dependent protein [Candidatus Parcubacteria bacterium]|nr:cobalamin-dependent protein [Candidatus Parcubacteria bacterium]